MPLIRTKLEEFGSQVKRGTISGDRINTITVVLGYLKGTNNISNEQVKSCEKLLHDWVIIKQKENYSINVKTTVLAEYQDTAFENYSILQKFL